MSQLPNIGASSNPLSTRQEAVKKDALTDLKLDGFLKLMITELQNQDPLNPLENDQLIAQIGEIRAIAATDKLTATLDTVLLGQNISSATNLIGAEIDAISDDSQRVTGKVERVSVSQGVPKLHLDLGPKARASDAKGDVEEGVYQYWVVWDAGGTLVGVDPLAKPDGSQGSISVSGAPGVDQAIEIGNLPVSTSSKQVFRRKGTSGEFHLAGTINNGKTASFLDTSATSKLSNFVLPVAPQPIDAKRKFVVSLNNVGEIRPPAEQRVSN